MARKKTIRQFMALVKKSVPEGEMYSMDEFTKFLKKKDKSFSPSQYGYEEMLDLLKDCDEQMTLKEDTEYTPSKWSVGLPVAEIFTPHGQVFPVSQAPKEEKPQSSVMPDFPLDEEEGEADEEEWNYVPENEAKKIIVGSSIDNPSTPASGMELNEGESHTQRGNSYSPLVPYTSLFSHYSGQPRTSYFAKVFYDDRDYDMVYKRLAEIANPEDWSGRGADGEYYVLKNYLRYTFLRAYEQNKIAYSEDGTQACFNTGLLTKSSGKDIYLSFRKNESTAYMKDTEWIFDDMFDSISAKLRPFRGKPEIATFIENPSDLVFDYSYDIEIDLDHIVHDNRERLSVIPELSNNPTIAMLAIEGALEKIRRRVIRGYRIAIPHWYSNRIQLLFPFITNGGEPKLAFALQKDDQMRLYRVKTLLTREMAYSNARILRKLNNDWLSA